MAKLGVSRSSGAVGPFFLRDYIGFLSFFNALSILGLLGNICSFFLGFWKQNPRRTLAF